MSDSYKKYEEIMDNEKPILKGLKENIETINKDYRMTSNPMVKLTGLHYELKESSLEKYHNIKENGERLMFDWEKEFDTNKDFGSDYPTKPFIEPFEFLEEDYNITEKKLRIRLKDIFCYIENKYGITEITSSQDVTFTVKESIEHLDNLFGY